MKNRLSRQMLPMLLITIFTFSFAFNGQALAAEKYTGKTIKLRLACASPTGTNMLVGFQKFADIVEAKSEGKVKIKVFGNAILGSERAAMEGVQLGTLDMASISSPNFASFSREFLVFDLPYITSPKYQQNLYAAIDSGKLGKHLTNIIEDIGLKPLIFSEFGYRKFASTEKPLNTMADLKGLKVRTTASPIEVSVARALGMMPSPIAWGEVYTSLQQGTVEAEGNNYEHMVNAKHIEVLKYAMETNHNYSMSMLMINKKKFAAFPLPVQELLVESGQEALKWQREISIEHEAVAEQAMLDSGIIIQKLSAEEQAKIVTATRVVWDEYKDEINPEIIQLVKDTQK